MSTKRLTLILSLVAICTTLNAAPVVVNGPLGYDESIDGDIEGQTIFNVSQGLNTISGSIVTGSLLDTDKIYFLVPQGMNAALDISMLFDNGGGPATFSSTWELRTHPSLASCPSFCFLGNGDALAGEIYGTTSNGILPEGSSLISDIASLGSGSYVLGQIGSVIDSPVFPPPADFTDYPYSTEYTIQLSVATVPIPATPLLFISGLLSVISLTMRPSRRNKLRGLA